MYKVDDTGYGADEIMLDGLGALLRQTLNK